MNTNGSWFLATNVSFTTKLASGTTGAPGANKWFTLRLQVANGNASGYISSTLLFSTPVTSRKGWAAIGTGSYQRVRFDNFVLKSGQEMCKTPYSGEAVLIYTCNTQSGGTSPSETWAINADGTISLRDSQNKLCLNASGTDPDIYLANCSPTSAQIFVYDATSHTIKQKSTGLCLDIVGQNSADGARVELYQCNGQNNQEWYYNATSGFLTTGLNQKCVSTCL